MQVHSGSLALAFRLSIIRPGWQWSWVLKMSGWPIEGMNEFRHHRIAQGEEDERNCRGPRLRVQRRTSVHGGSHPRNDSSSGIGTSAAAAVSGRRDIAAACCLVFQSCNSVRDHIDWAASKFLWKNLHVGLVGYYWCLQDARRVHRTADRISVSGCSHAWLH